MPDVGRLLADVVADLAYAVRRMRAAPAFTAIAISILAIALGGNIAVFTLVDAVLLRTLPVDRPHELRELAWVGRRDSPLQITYSGGMRPSSPSGVLATSFAYPIYEAIRDTSATFADVFLFEQRVIDAKTDGTRQRITAMLASGNLLTGLGVRMSLGRTMTAADDRTDASPVVVLTHRFWQRQFGHDPAVIGRTLVIGTSSVTVVGVTTAPFDGLEPGSPIDVILPITPVLPALETGSNPLTDSRRWRFRMMARVPRDVDEPRVEAAASDVLRRAVSANGIAGDVEDLRVTSTPAERGLGDLRQTYQRSLLLLMAITSVVFVVGCANVAGLLLARAAGRSREMTLRLMMGAARGRLIRQLLVESGLLVATAALLGAGLASLTGSALLAMLDPGRPPALSLGQTPAVLLFAMGLAIAASMLCGLLPALRTPRSATDAARRVHSGATAPPRLSGAPALIAFQVAVSLMLLIGAGLFVRTLFNLRAQPVGFRPDHLLLFDLDPAASGHDSAHTRNIPARVVDRIAALPDVRHAAASRYPLLSGGRTTDTILVPGAPSGQDEIRVHLHFVSAGYLETMGIALRAGRDFTPADTELSPRVALANEALARLLQRSGSVQGRRVLYDRPDVGVEIVGVTADARLATLREPAPPTLYLPYVQYPQRRLTIAARVDGDPLALAPAARRVVAEIDPEMTVLAVRTQEAQIAALIVRERLFAGVASGFAALALALACLGLYGALAYSVSRRTREIGVRMALGANQWQVIALVIRESLVPVSAGVAIGLAAAALATRLVESMLFGLRPNDALTIALAIAALMGSAMLAAWIPSRRASAVDPMAALRCE